MEEEQVSGADPGGSGLVEDAAGSEEAVVQHDNAPPQAWSLEDDRRKGLAGGLAIGCSTVAAAAVRHYAVRWPVFSTSSKSWPHPSIGVDVLRRTPLHGEPNGGGSVLGRHVGDTRHTCTCSRTENVDVLYMHLFSYQAC